MLLKVNICCCNRLFGEGIQSLLEGALPEASVVATSEDYRNVLNDSPDLVIVDFRILSTISLEDIAGHGVKMLLLGTACTPLMEDEYFISLVSTGLIGILSPAAVADELIKAIKGISSGDLWFPRKKLEDVLIHRQAAEGERAMKLTNREREVLKLLCRGYRNKEIMEALNLSEQSIKSYISRMCRKFSVNDRLQLALMAVRQWPHYLRDL